MGGLHCDCDDHLLELQWYLTIPIDIHKPWNADCLNCQCIFTLTTSGAQWPVAQLVESVNDRTYYVYFTLNHIFAYMKVISSFMENVIE